MVVDAKEQNHASHCNSTAQNQIYIFILRQQHIYVFHGVVNLVDKHQNSRMLMNENSEPFLILKTLLCNACGTSVSKSVKLAKLLLIVLQMLHQTQQYHAI